jgi:RNA polymerase sigma-70 factor (ECF subfamily)
MIGERRFADLVRAHAGAVSAYARAVAPDRWTAEDAVQETFLRAWKYLDSYRATGSFEGWLIRICHNCLVDLTTRRVPEPVSDFPETPQPADHSWEVHELLDDLPIQQREVVALCCLLGYDYAEAAELLAIPVGTVRSRLHRARATMATRLRSEVDEVDEVSA